LQPRQQQQIYSSSNSIINTNAVNVNASSPMVVHAFSDGPYDRSSFHLAGTADDVAAVTSQFTQKALASILEFQQKEQQQQQQQESDICKNDSSPQKTAHPNVGLIDHVSIMPLLLPKIIQEQHDNEADNPPMKSLMLDSAEMPTEEEQRIAAGDAAKHVGEAMRDAGCRVLYYGWASPPDHKPLAEVRREQTFFFKSGGLEALPAALEESQSQPPSAAKDSATRHPMMGTACVGAPPNFVENFNVRLALSQEGSNTNTLSMSTADLRKRAMALCKHVRERDGGLAGVEALTLPYGKSQFEVACNLLQPHIGSRDAIRNKVQEWYTKNASGSEFEIDAMYGVGSTQHMCLDALCSTDIDAYDKEVMARFENYLTT
jgi:hypothetical protein